MNWIVFILFACIFLNGCEVANTVGIISAHNEIREIKNVIIKTERGITFDLYCSNQSEVDANQWGIPLNQEVPKCKYNAKVKYIQQDSDASRSGIQVGDQIIKVNGIELLNEYDIRDAFFTENRQPVILTIRRDNKIFQIRMMPL